MAVEENAADGVPQWVHRWKHKAKLPTKLRSTCKEHAGEHAGEHEEDISDPKSSPNKHSPRNSPRRSGEQKKSPFMNPMPPPPDAPRANVPAPAFDRVFSEGFALPASLSDKEAKVPSMSPSPEKSSRAFAPGAAPSSPGPHDAAVRDVLMMDMAEERVRRRDAEEGKQAAVELAHHLHMQLDGLRNECLRLQMEMRRMTPGAAESAEDARGLAALYKRLAGEAEAVAAQKEMEEEEAMGNEDEIDTSKMVPMSVALGQKEGEPPPTPAHQKDLEKLKEEEEFQALQTNFMGLQYDDMFEALEAREADLTLLLIRASWLRKHHNETESSEELLPNKGEYLPPDAKVTARELKMMFEHAPGCRGYRKVDLPFITLAQFWKSTEHPDPDEEVLQGVIQYLQARWEEFTERDVGIFIDIGEEPDAAEGGSVVASPVFWLVTSRARTKMAEAQHDAYMDYMERQNAAAGVGVGTPGPRSSAPAAAGAGEEGNAAEMAARVGGKDGPGLPAMVGSPSSATLAPEGWSSARSDASHSDASVGAHSVGAHSKSSSRAAEDMQ